MRVLLHICCGPCAMAPLAALGQDGEGHALAGYFDNPNIHPLAEYCRRRESALKAADSAKIPMLFPLTENEYNAASWCRDALTAQAAAGSPDGRCTHCFSSRLDRTARRARAEGFDAFTSSLLYSRRQNHEGIRRAAGEAAEKHGILFLYRDFRPLWQKGINASKALGLYRQQYCGCLFSEEDRYRNDFRKATGLTGR